MGMRKVGAKESLTEDWTGKKKRRTLSTTERKRRRVPVMDALSQTRAAR